MTEKLSVKLCIAGMLLLGSASLASAHIRARHHDAQHVYAHRLQGRLQAPMAATDAAAIRPYQAYAGDAGAFESVHHVYDVAPVTTVAAGSARDPYHLPESYNYDWPYGLGLSH